MSRYLSPPEVAAQLRVARSNVVAWINAGELAAIDTSKVKNSKRPRWRVSPDAVKAFLESRRNYVKPQRTKVAQQIRRKEYV